MQIPLLSSPPKMSHQLPCTLISLEQWVLINIYGIDAIKYLQGQLTCDLNTLSRKQYTFSAHCNPQGKVIGNMYVFHLNSGIALIERRNIYQKQINAIKKYSVFSKITIQKNENCILLGIAGSHAREKLKNLFNILPNQTTNITYDHKATILYFNLPQERFLLVTTKKIQEEILQKLKNKIEVNNSLQWIALDIEAGYPLINIKTTEKFIPQAINMHILNGISFNKGCYIGQEIIAHMQYKKNNKHALYWLIGNSDYLPQPGNHLETKINNHWIFSGLVLESCRINTNDIWIQAVLDNKIPQNNSFRIQNFHDSIFNIYPSS